MEDGLGRVTKLALVVKRQWPTKTFQKALIESEKRKSYGALGRKSETKGQNGRDVVGVVGKKKKKKKKNRQSTVY